MCGICWTVGGYGLTVDLLAWEIDVLPFGRSIASQRQLSTIAQAISKRVHYGMFVAESKFRSDEQLYTSLIRARDAEGLMQAITDAPVEAKVRGSVCGGREWGRVYLSRLS